MLGVPSDRGSSFRFGAAGGPARIRERLVSPAGNLCSESGLDLAGDARWRDAGDVAVAAAGDEREAIAAAVGELLAGGERVLALGGDHAITFPIVRAYARQWEPLTVVQLDAHPDLYDELDGDRYSHACPFARIMEEGRVARLVQVGIRAATAHQRAQARAFGVEMLEMAVWDGELPGDLRAPVYLSVDLDALDPAFAPGVSHPEPGGLSSRDALRIVRSLEGMLVGADVVELNPALDPYGLTAAVAAKLVKEIVAAMLRGKNEPAG